MAGYDLSKTGAEHFARMYFIRSLNSLIIVNTERSLLITFGLHWFHVRMKIFAQIRSPNIMQCDFIIKQTKWVN